MFKTDAKSDKFVIFPCQKFVSVSGEQENNKIKLICHLGPRHFHCSLVQQS